MTATIHNEGGVPGLRVIQANPASRGVVGIAGI